MAGRAKVAAGLLRQGDVLLIPVDENMVGENRAAPGVREPVARRDGRLVLAEGEATGHAHVVVGEQARLERQRFGTLRPVWINRSTWRRERTVLIVSEVPALLEHEEHDELVIPPGAYEV